MAKVLVLAVPTDGLPVLQVMSEDPVIADYILANPGLVEPYDLNMLVYYEATTILHRSEDPSKPTVEIRLQRISKVSIFDAGSEMR